MRCKVKLQSITQTMGTSYVDGQYIKKPNYTLNYFPVVGDSEENKKFFTSTPGGQISLSTINPDVVGNLELDAEYYVDFTPVNQ